LAITIKIINFVQNKKNMKQICNTHHFFYEGKKCPFCERERIDGLAKKFVVIDHLDVIGNYRPKTSNDIDITEERLKKLTEKFKIKRK
jgi:hypothetical protein